MLKTKKFQRKKEDFVCEHCSKEIKGSGYTNHCPFCLWSKHVDVNPGDRAASCGGIMRPMRVEIKKGEHSIVNRCEKCGHEKRNKIADNDNFDEIIKLSKNTSI